MFDEATPDLAPMLEVDIASAATADLPLPRPAVAGKIDNALQSTWLRKNSSPGC